MCIDRYRLAEIADFICETDLQCMPTIVDVFNHFGCFEIGSDQWSIRLGIKARNGVATIPVEFTDNDFARSSEVSDSGSLAEKLRVHTQSKVAASLLSGSLL